MNDHLPDFRSYKMTAKLLIAAIVLVLESFISAFLLLFGWIALFVCLWLTGYSSRDTTILFWIGSIVTFFMGTGNFSLPSRQQIIRRLEKDSRLAHRPLQSLYDQAATTGSEEMWQLEKSRQHKLLDRLKTVRPVFNLANQDPYALRILVLLVLFCIGFMAPDSWGQKIKNGLFLPIDEEAAASAQNFTQIRITPPAYTGLKPLFLKEASNAPVDLIAGTTISAEIKADWGHPVLKMGKIDVALNRKSDSDLWSIETGVAPADHIRITTYGFPLFSQKVNWVEDKAPAVAWNSKIEILPTGEMKIPLKVDDDFGIDKLTLHAILAPDETPPHFGSALAIEKKMTLSLHNASADIAPVFDATGHFWAGRKVSLMIEAQDYAGNISDTTPLDMVLPERTFRNPLARQLASIRSGLLEMTLDIDNLVMATESILFRPDLYNWDTTMTLGLRSVASRLTYAQSEKDMESVADLLWSLAMQMEDGRISETQTSLRDAISNLQQAIQKGADKAEIARLTQEMQQALLQHLQNLAHQVMKQAQEQGQPIQSTMNLSGLNEFLQKLQQDLQNGDAQSAMQKLNQLQQLTEMLGSSAAQGIPKDVQEMMQNVQALQQIIDRQKNLMDQTREADREKLPDQAKEQKNIKVATDALKEKEKKNTEALDAASGEMTKSGQALETKDSDVSLQAQQNALDKLQQANKSMQEQLKERMQQMMSISLGGAGGQQDPLGRSQQQLNDENTEIPEGGKQKRVDQIIKTLRDREGDMKRSVEERNYFQRLLKQW